MRFLLLLICCGWFLPFSILAQTISGRVVDATTGKGIAGTTVLQSGTINGTVNGTSSDPDGYFTLSIMGKADSVKLVFSAITYVSKDQLLYPDQNVLIRLTRGLICYGEPRAEFALSSGLRYAPYGGNIKVNGGTFTRLPLTATLGYQSNFSRNYALATGLSFPGFWQPRYIISEALDYEQLQAITANTRFTSYRATVSIGNFYKLALLRQLIFMLGGGYANYQALPASDAGSISGFGYSIGLQNNYYASPSHLAGTIQATRWPGYWQWQGQLVHHLSHGFKAGASFNQVQRYIEFTLLIGYDFY